MEQPVAQGIERGCGFRVAGGAYLETKLSKHGRPIGGFLTDPPVAIDPETIGLTARGIQLIQRAGTDIWDVWDIVGEAEYPNAADFISELGRFGISRRIAKTADFSKLTADSRLILLHRRASVLNPDAYFVEDGSQRVFCPTNNPGHQDHNARIAKLDTGHCLGLVYLDLDPKTCEVVLDPAVPYRAVERTMPGFTYRAFRRPDNVTPIYQTAIFGVFPIGQISVIRDVESGTHKEVVDAANKAGLPVIVEGQ